MGLSGTWELMQRPPTHTHTRTHTHMHTHTHTHTPAGPHRQNPCSTAASCTRKSHRRSSSSSPPAPAWLPESQGEIWIVFFFWMSYSSEPIYFMVQLQPSPWAAAEGVPTEQPQGRGREWSFLLEAPLHRRANVGPGAGWGGRAPICRGSCWAFCLLQTGP